MSNERKEVFPDRVEYTDCNGEYHREDGPAIEWDNGTSYWFKHGTSHREDAPAVESPIDTYKSWWVDGVPVATLQRGVLVVTADHIPPAIKSSIAIEMLKNG